MQVRIPSEQHQVMIEAVENHMPEVIVIDEIGTEQEAMAARVEGTVVLEIIVDERGVVPDARVVRSIPLLDQSALEAVKQWRFTPTVVDGQALPVIVQVEMTFTLK